MNDLINFAKKLSASPSNDELQLLVKKFEGSHKVFRKNVGNVESALHELNPLQHTFAYIELLVFKGGLDKINVPEFIEQAKALFVSGDVNQIKLSQKNFNMICRQYTKQLILNDCCIRGVGPLISAVNKLIAINGPHLLTPAHTDLALCALKAKTYHAVKPILELPTCKIDKDKTGMDERDYMQYYYYAGLCFSALKQWSSAVDSFLLVLIIPSSALSAIQLCAYKKYLLVSLLYRGEVEPLSSRSVSSVLLRHLDQLTQPYQDIVKAHKQANLEQLDRAFAQNIDGFRVDGSVGLLKQLRVGIVAKEILKLTSTYVTLSFQQIANSLNTKDVETVKKQVVQMIKSGAVYARVDDRSGNVSFLENPVTYDDNIVIEGIQKKIDQVMSLSSLVSALDRSISVSTNYISRTDRSLRKDAEGGGDRRGGGVGPDDDLELRMAIEQSQRDQ